MKEQHLSVVSLRSDTHLLVPRTKSKPWMDGGKCTNKIIGTENHWTYSCQECCVFFISQTETAKVPKTNTVLRPHRFAFSAQVKLSLDVGSHSKSKGFRADKKKITSMFICSTVLEYLVFFLQEASERRMFNLVLQVASF